MLPRNRWFIAAALAYALLGGLLGLAWLAQPAALPPLARRDAGVRQMGGTAAA